MHYFSLQSCRAAWDALPEEVPESESQWYALEDNGRIQLHFADPMDPASSACGRVHHLDKLHSFSPEEFPSRDLCPHCAGVLPDALSTFASPFDV